MNARTLLFATALLTAAASVSAGPETVTIRTADELSLAADYFAAGTKGAPAVF